MNHLARFSKFARHVFTFLVHFAHGGFVMAGVLVVGFVGFMVTQHGAESLNPRNLFAQSLNPVQAMEVAVPAAEASVDASAEASVEASAVAANTALSAEDRRVVLAIAKRHKVSPLVVQSLIKTIDKEARANGLDPLLILAVVTVESGFNPFAESVFGAQGLMQIIPKYHQDKITLEKGSIALFDPAENIRVGAKILKEYVQSSNSLESALQLYGGAPNDPDMQYASRVLGEQERLKQIASNAKPKVLSNARAADWVPAS